MNKMEEVKGQEYTKRRTRKLEEERTRLLDRLKEMEDAIPDIRNAITQHTATHYNLNGAVDASL
jgi:hypothetical protein